MSHPALDNSNSAAPSEDDFARVRIVAVDDGTRLMKVGDSLELMVDPSTVSLHVFMSQEALDAFLKDTNSRDEVVVHLETVDDDLDEPTLEVDRETERIRMRAANDEPEIVASDIRKALKSSFQAVLSTLRRLRRSATPAPLPRDQWENIHFVT